MADTVHYQYLSLGPDIKSMCCSVPYCECKHIVTASILMTLYCHRSK